VIAETRLLERLTASDLFLLLWEDYGWSTDIGGLAILDGTSLLDREHVEGALERAGLHRRLERPPAMCFLDLSGYTRLTEEPGDEAAADLAARLAGLVRRSAQEHGGTPVKWLGDGVMFCFRQPGAAVLAAVEMVAVVGRHGLPPAHVGIHAGPVIFQEGDYFGRTVNLAARIAAYARPCEVLVSQEVVNAAD
jgi:adenylate cyclase